LLIDELEQVNVFFKNSEIKGEIKELKSVNIPKNLKAVIKDKYLGFGYSFSNPTGSSYRAYTLVRGHNNHIIKIRATLYILNQQIEEDGFLLFIETFNKYILP
jgi:hypothetical protein